MICTSFFIAVGLLSLVCGTPDGRSTCGDWAMSPDATKCFKMLDNKGTWEEAKNECQKLEKTAHLPEPQSKEEERSFKSILPEGMKDNIWIGLRRDSKTGDFTWSDGTVSSRVDGSTSDDDCVEYNLCLSKLYPAFCDDKHVIICEKPSKPSTGTPVRPGGITPTSIPPISVPSPGPENKECIDPKQEEKLIERIHQLELQVQSQSSDDLGVCNNCCPKEFINLYGRCYYFGLTQIMDYPLAFQQCQKLNPYAQMIQLETDEEYNIISEYINDHASLKKFSWWIGATDNGTEGTWRWVTNNETMFIKNDPKYETAKIRGFMAGLPDNYESATYGDENCAFIHQFTYPTQYNDIQCVKTPHVGYLLHPLCEIYPPSQKKN